jgi:thiamine-phosphate pyrophosphorylase
LKVLVNRRVDVALAIGADGVHLGFDALSPNAAASLLESLAPSGAEIGISAHTSEEVKAAAETAATYAHLAPIWTPLSKPATRRALGVEALAAASRTGLPVFAQGGITPERCAAALAAGAVGVAVTGDILLARDPGRAAAALRAALDD